MTTPRFRAGRAWMISVAACVTALAIWTVLMQALVGRWGPLWNNLLNATVAFGGIYAIVAAVIYVPAFLATGWLLRRRLTPARAAIGGAVLAPLILIVIALVFRESGDPKTIAGMVVQLAQFWARNPAEFVLGSIPYAIAGAVFGFAGTARPTADTTGGAVSG